MLVDINKCWWIFTNGGHINVGGYLQMYDKCVITFAQMFPNIYK